jgi:hypothetical protein
MQKHEEAVKMRVIRILAACVLAAACQRDVPVQPQPPADAGTTDAPAAALSAADRAALAAAITDAQAWLLPSIGERDVTTDAIAGRFADLATSLERGESSALATRIATARQELEAVVADRAAERLIELAALGLVLDGVEAVIQGRLRLVPFDAAALDAPPDAPRSANEPKRPTLERNLP